MTISWIAHSSSSKPEYSPNEGCVSPRLSSRIWLSTQQQKFHCETPISVA
jgi:hypothetical protein